jgi:hypothetical protein
MPPLSALQHGPATQALLSGWRWWTGELADLVPTALKRRWTRSPAALIYPSSTCVEIDRVADGHGERFLETRALADFDAENWAELASLTAQCRTHLVLRAPDIFVTHLTLPLAARRNWRSATALQLDQLAPLDPALLVWNARIVRQNSADFTVQLVVAKAAKIAALHALFEDQQLPTPPIDADLGNERMALAQGDARAVDPDRDLWRKALIVSVALLVSVPLTTLVGAILFSWSLERKSELLSSSIAPRLERERAWQRGEHARQALAGVSAHAAVSPVLEDVARLLPKSGFVQSIARSADRSLLVSVTTPEPKQAAEALRASTALPGLDLVDESAANGAAMTITFRTSPR